MQKIIPMNKWDASGRLFRIVIVLLLIVILLTSCAAGTGIFSGGKWQSGGLQHQQIRTLTVNPNNPQIIYAGDAQDGVFVSTNAGMGKGSMLQQIKVFLLVPMLPNTGQV